MKRHLRIIGDVHGKINHRESGRSYLNLAQASEYSLQIGDLGFDYSELSKLDPSKHRVVGGNHDNYVALTEHFLGNSGTYAFPGFEFFYVRGGFSIDCGLRTEGVDLFQDPNLEMQEELTHQQANEAIDHYLRVKPKIMVSHEAPENIGELICDNDWNIAPSFTSKLLNHMLKQHQPDMWIFGHWHRNWRHYYAGKGVTYKGKEVMHEGNFSGTMFYCLAELCYLDFDENGSPLTEMPI